MDTILKNSTNPDHQALYAKLLASQNTGNTIYGDLFENYAQDFPEQAKLWQEKINLQEQSQKIFRQLCLRIMDAPESEIESWRKQIYDKKYNEIVSTFNQDNENIWDYVNNHVYHVFSGVPSAFINGIALPKSLASDKEFVEQISTIFPKVMIFDREGEVIKDYPKELKQETSIEKGK